MKNLLKRLRLKWLLTQMSIKRSLMAAKRELVAAELRKLDNEIEQHDGEALVLMRELGNLEWNKKYPVDGIHGV